MVGAPNIKLLSFTCKISTRFGEYILGKIRFLTLSRLGGGDNVVLRSALVELLGFQILFHWTGLKKLVQKHVQHNLVYALSPEIPGGGRNPPPPILYYAKEKADQDRIKLSTLLVKTKTGSNHFCILLMHVCSIVLVV